MTAHAADPTIQLPPGESVSVWREPLALAGLRPATSGSPTVRVVVTGGRWSIELAGAAGAGPVQVPAPTTPSDREAIAWLASSLTAPLDLSGLPPGPPPAPAPAGAPAAPPAVRAATPATRPVVRTAAPATVAEPAVISAPVDGAPVASAAVPEVPATASSAAPATASSAAPATAPATASSAAPTTAPATASSAAPTTAPAPTLPPGAAPATTVVSATPPGLLVPGAPPPLLVPGAPPAVAGATEATSPAPIGAPATAAPPVAQVATAPAPATTAPAVAPTTEPPADAEPAVADAAPAVAEPPEPVARPTRAAPPVQATVLAAGGAALQGGVAPGGSGRIGAGLVVLEHLAVRVALSVSGPSRPTEPQMAEGRATVGLWATVGWEAPWTWAPSVTALCGGERLAFAQDGAVIASGWIPSCGAGVGLHRALPRGLSIGLEASVRQELRGVQIRVDDAVLDSRSPTVFDVAASLRWRSRTKTRAE